MKRFSKFIQEPVELNEKLKASDDMGDWVKDFQDSDAPQFKGKSMKKRQQMAIAAKLAAEREAGMRKEEFELDEVSRDLARKTAKTRQQQASQLRQKAVDEPDMMKAFAQTKAANKAEKKAGQSYNRLMKKEEVDLTENVYEEVANYLVSEGIDLDNLSEAQLDELVGAAARRPSAIRRAPRPLKPRRAPRPLKPRPASRPRKPRGGAGQIAARALGRGIKRTFVNKKGNFRFSTAGRADAADAKAKKLEKARKDRERLQKARERIQQERQRAAQARRT
jgi:hypothetical protein